MKFRRNLRIIRGQLDVAPFASVFFLLVIFILFNSSLVFTPGIAVKLPPLSEPGNRMDIFLSANGNYQFRGKDYRENALVETLTSAIADKQAKKIIVVAEPGADSKSLDRLRKFATDNGLEWQVHKQGIELPVTGAWPGQTNPFVTVAVSLNGQFFFDNQIIRPTDLQRRLKLARQEGGENLCLVIQADKDVRYNTIIELSEIARRAGIKEVFLATRPSLHSRCRENAPATSLFVSYRSTRDTRLPHASSATHFGDNSIGRSFLIGTYSV